MGDMEEVRSVFHFFSDDGGEHIGLAKVGTVLRTLGRTPTNAQIESLCDGLRGKDSISLEEFIPILNALQDAELVSADVLAASLSQFDKDGSGYIKAAELRRLLTTIGDKLTDQEVDDLLAGQQDSEGNVNVAQFVQSIMNC
uniref:EF-hand domain-containing protein n=1 Tax=Trichuris muris TaxID=70415 RepID=A0A5S6QQM6_TRIMR